MERKRDNMKSGFGLKTGFKQLGGILVCMKCNTAMLLHFKQARQSAITDAANDRKFNKDAA